MTNEQSARQRGGRPRDVCGFRWKVEQFHRETKQLTGLESVSAARPALSAIISAAPRSGAQQVADETQRTIYQVKHGLLDDYLRQQLKAPAIKMRLKSPDSTK